MNAKVSLTARKLKWLAPLVALVLLAGVAQPSERLAIPGEYPGGPFYARLLFGVGYTNTVAIVFYRSPECVPDDFNLLQVFDPNLNFDACPILMEGFAIWEDGADPSLDAPYQQQLHDVKGTPVPIWFVSLDDVLAAINDGILTIGELEGMDSLRTGSADSYHEILQPFFPSGGAKVPKINIVASGALQDGRSFFMLWEHTNTPFLTETILRFGE